MQLEHVVDCAVENEPGAHDPETPSCPRPTQNEPDGHGMHIPDAGEGWYVLAAQAMHNNAEGEAANWPAEQSLQDDTLAAEY